MKKIYLLFSLLLTVFSCSEMDELIPESTQSKATTRLSGDGEYDVLGMGYDVTGEYLHPLSVCNPIIDIQKYKKDYPNRLVTGTPSFGYDQFYYGYSSSDYVKDVTTETNAGANLSYDGGKKDTVSLFSGNINRNSYFKSEYSYSDKYSFASVDAVRNRKYIRINDEVSRLSQYLSDDFKEDLNRLSPERLIERYGTHVLTDFIIGGRYKLMFRSVITKSRDASTKRKTVATGLKVSLSKIGFSLNASRTVQTDESLTKENQHKELYVLFYGGNGTNLKYDLEKGVPTAVDVQGWENSVKLENACLNSITWKETHPIYSFISDPIKKEVVKAAIERYIENSRLKVLELLPLYTYLTTGSKMNHLVTTNPDIVESFPGYRFDQIEGYILKKQLPGTIALYEYYCHSCINHNATVIPNFHLLYPTYEKMGLFGYVYKNVNMETVPLYEYFSDEANDHYASTIPDISGLFPGWRRVNNAPGYVYPAD